MPIRILTALLCLIAAPLALLGWIGFVLIRNEELNAKRQVTSLAEGRLKELVRSIDGVMSGHHRALKQKMVRQGIAEQLMSVERTDPFVRRAMWVSARGQLLYPSAPTTNASNEFLIYNELLMMARQRPPVPISVRKAMVAADTISSQSTRSSAATREGFQNRDRTIQVQESAEPETSKTDTLWHESYFDEGLQLVVWDVLPDGSATGYWLERARWIADLISILPDVDPQTTNGATALTDANGNVLYRWGTGDIVMEQPLAEVPLKEPLAAWRLKYYLQDQQSGAASWVRFLPWALGISVIGVSLLGLGAYVTFATMHQLKLADQRVSFVGQVSHELRTPLTNIRLYAEMAQRDLTQENPTVSRIANRLGVIDSESKRLSRLISGVLEFMQGRTSAQSLAWRLAVPDDAVRHVLNQFAPSLSRCEIVVTTDLNATQSVEMDTDVLEQILINLVNNVEKYASAGKAIHLSSRLENDMLTIEVCDAGPGIPARFRKRIFQPFFRLDDANTAPSGTGLGLTIARKAAIRHGGGLELVDSQRGCQFRLTLRVRRILSATESRQS